MAPNAAVKTMILQNLFIVFGCRPASPAFTKFAKRAAIRNFCSAPAGSSQQLQMEKRPAALSGAEANRGLVFERLSHCVVVNVNSSPSRALKSRHHGKVPRSQQRRTSHVIAQL
jgi:hypothetical protein